MTTVASFNVEYTRFLDANGNLVNTLPELLKDKQVLRRLYSIMVTTRAFDTKAINLQRTGKISTYASTLGQEAISAGYGMAMQLDDVLVPYYRDYAAQFLRGVTMTEILRYWGGDERGNYFANNKHDLPMCVPIGTQLLHAVGIAKALQYKNKPQAVLVTCGDGATSEGDFYEAINLAGCWQLPIVFVVNNNQWAISVPRASQTQCQTIAQKAIAGGFSGEQVDGNDVLAVYDRAFLALEKARQGHGPTLIEAITYRLCDHTTADDASRYRSANELTKAWEEEPIKRLKNYLLAIKAWSEEDESALVAQNSLAVDAAVADYLATPAQPVTSIFDYLYATLPANLIEQRNQAEKYGE